MISPLRTLTAGYANNDAAQLVKATRKCAGNGDAITASLREQTKGKKK